MSFESKHREKLALLSNEACFVMGEEEAGIDRGLTRLKVNSRDAQLVFFKANKPTAKSQMLPFN